MERTPSYTIADARAHLTDILNQAAYGKERIKIMRRDKPLAYVVPIEDVDFLEHLEDVYDLKAAQEALNEAKSEGFVSWDDLKKELKL